MKKTNRKGFTIVELVIVIAVIAILAAVLIPTFSGIIEKANESAALQEAENAMKQDLIDAQADYKNIGNVYVKTTDTAIVTGKTYYTFAAPDYTAVVGPVVESIDTYYEELCEGEYDVGTKTYTYRTAKGYTCVFNTTSGLWTITKPVA